MGPSVSEISYSNQLTYKIKHKLAALLLVKINISQVLRTSTEFCSTFDKNFQLVDRTPIPNVTICTLDPETGEAKNSWGSNMFYVPHGLAVDLAGNTYITDVGLHQVMRVSKTTNLNTISCDELAEQSILLLENQPFQNNA